MTFIKEVFHMFWIGFLYGIIPAVVVVKIMRSFFEAKKKEAQQKDIRLRLPESL